MGHGGLYVGACCGSATVGWKDGMARILGLEAGQGWRPVARSAACDMRFSKRRDQIVEVCCMDPGLEDPENSSGGGSLGWGVLW